MFNYSILVKNVHGRKVSCNVTLFPKLGEDFDIYSLFQCVHDILILKSFKILINDQNVDLV